MFIKYCVFSLKFVIFLNSASSAAALDFYLPGVCTVHWHRGENRERPESGIFYNLRKKNTIFNEHPVLFERQLITTTDTIFCNNPQQLREARKQFVRMLLCITIVQYWASLKKLSSIRGNVRYDFLPFLLLHGLPQEVPKISPFLISITS